MSTAVAAFAGLPACTWTRGRSVGAPHSTAQPLRAHLRRNWRPRGIPRMSGENAEDEAPSDTFVEEAASAVSDALDVDSPERRRVLDTLLRLCAATSRGQLASASQKANVDDAVARLEEISPVKEAVNSEFIDGTWTLVYTTAKLFRTSPFLAAAATPLLDVGQVRQKIDVGGGKLSTEVDVVAFPATSGTLRTAARITPVGAERLEVVVEKTTVVGGQIAERFDLGGISFDVPVESIYSRIKGSSPETYFDTYYLDENVRVSRSKAGSLYVYVKE